MNYTKEELDNRYMIIRSAIASQRLEGLTPDPQAVEDTYRAARGELTMAEVRTRYMTRIKAGNI